MPELHGKLDGFSLLEVLLTLFILSFALLPLSAMVANSLQQVRGSDAASRLLLAASNLAEARQLETVRNGKAGPLEAVTTEALQQTVQTLWPDQSPLLALTCREPGGLPATVAAADCAAPAQLWLHLTLASGPSWQLPVD
ncbi:prepilin-type N-terminal cleavage/methylation domain-containing protein [Aquitalea sp.]|uniref:type IV pilus modification PilV family protein n=1 Tax=Aquitalea sp. TaxID=1872623 RepID=UPI002588D8C6|nr:prepilin-type N-terminal cleavage/methylation domain-containing protein [Aquitalea sp.]